MNKKIRIRTGIAIIHQQKLLMVPHFSENRPTRWYLPGGKIEFGERIEEAVLRELKEETGISASIVDFIDINERIEPHYHSISLCFLGQYLGGKIKAEVHPKYGQKEPKWFAPEELKEIIYRPKNVIDQLLFTDNKE